MRFAAIILLVSCVWVPAAPALASGPLFRCKHRSSDTETFTNDRGVLEKYKRAGWRCEVYLQFGASRGGGGGATGESGGAALPQVGGGIKAPAVAMVAGGVPGRDDDRVRQVLPFALEASQKYTIPVPFILAVVKVESGFVPSAVSPVGAQGLMQVMPFNCKRLGISDPFDPRQNILGGTMLLRLLANRFEGDMVQVLSGYHAGGQAVENKAGIPFEQTDLYVKKVLDYYYHYKKYYAAE
jgi:hypothetical protein